MLIKKVWILRFLIYFLTVSSFVIALLYSIKPEINWIYIKDGSILFVIFLSFFLFINKNNIRITLWMMPIIFIGLYGYFISSADIFAKLASLRQYYIPFALFAIGFLYVKSEADYKAALKSIYFSILFIVFFGVFERGVYLWEIIDITNFYAVKNIPVFYTGYPVFFIEPISILGYRDFEYGIVRMVSTILDPVNLGHIFVFSYSMISYDANIKLNSHKKITLQIIILLCLLSTFSKGAFLQLFLVVIIFNGKIKNHIKIAISIIISPLIYYYITSHAGFSVHFNGLIKVLDYLSLFGHGASTFGNYSIMYNNLLDNMAGVGDSFWASILGQFGIIGFILWLGMLLFICYKIGFNNYLSKLIISQILVAALSENSFNLMSVVFLMFLSGSYLRFSSTYKAINKKIPA